MISIRNFLVFGILFVLASGYYQGNEPQYGPGLGEKRDYYAPPQYNFQYSVHDPHTGDYKAQKEHRDGDVVRGFYALKEADGTIREVHYTSDHHNGFNAQVKRTGHAVHPQHYTDTINLFRVLRLHHFC